MRVLTPILLLAFLAAQTAAADLLDAGREWKSLTVPGRPASSFTFTAPARIEIEASAAVGFLYRPVSLTDVREGATLSWRWRVDRTIPPRNQFRAGEDDRPIAVHLWFDHPDSETSLFGDIPRLLGYPRITHALTYVWGGSHAPGTIKPNPYFAQGRILVLASADAPVQQWLTETRDVQADIKRAFGDDADLAHLRYVALSADTDDGGDHSLAQITSLAWGPASVRQ